MTPATSVVQAIEFCAAAGIGVATILSAGFAELGPRGKRRQDDLTAAARRAGIRILGPNSLGIVNVTGQVALSANAVFEQEPLLPGGVSLISQSGSMLGAIVTRAQERGIGFSKLVAVGNECDIATGELVDLLVDDPETRVILLFLEALRDALPLAAAARRAYAAGKPIVAYKIGRSNTTQALAITHTGALTDEHEHAQAYFREHGILRADVLELLFEMPNLVLGHRPSSRHRLATLTVSGGGAAMVLDGLCDHRIDIVAPTDEVVARLNERSIRCAPGPVIDLPMGRARQWCLCRSAFDAAGIRSLRHRACGARVERRLLTAVGARSHPCGRDTDETPRRIHGAACRRSQQDIAAARHRGLSNAGGMCRCHPRLW